MPAASWIRDAAAVSRTGRSGGRYAACTRPARSPVVASGSPRRNCIMLSGGDTARRTDLENLVPLCEIHHQRVHHDGWLLRLAADRTLTITLPDGQVMTTGPPRRSAA